MKRLLTIFILGCLAFSAAAANRRQAVECTPRLGLPNFFEKIRSGRKDMTVVYFGGSITEQPGYRVQSLEFLRSLYPDVHFNGISSAIGWWINMSGAQ